MNERERFASVMNYQPFEWVPLWYFGEWKAARERWYTEGLPEGADVPEELGMDHNWMKYKSSLFNIVNMNGIVPGRSKSETIEENEDYRIVRNPDGSVVKSTKKSADAMSHTITYAMDGSRESWQRFKTYYDASTPERFVPDWRERLRAIDQLPYIRGIGQGGLFRFPEFWLGVEQVSYLPYDDPALFEEMLTFWADFHIAMFTPVLKEASFDYVYIFEDCCGSTGPLLSPDIYRKFYHPQYRRLCDFYRANGIDVILMDSDGKVDDLIPAWMESGINTIFPVEIGTWKASPIDFRRRFGKDLRIMGGVDKHVIAQGDQAIRDELLPLRELVAEGGYVPMPDHKIPPDCSYAQFARYVDIFKEIFWEN